jgi:hypothetical protein
MMSCIGVQLGLGDTSNRGTIQIGRDEQPSLPTTLVAAISNDWLKGDPRRSVCAGFEAKFDRAWARS